MKKWEQQKMDKIIKLYKETHNVKRVSEQLNISRQTIYKYLDKAKISEEQEK